MKPTIKNKKLDIILENVKTKKQPSNLEEIGFSIIGGYIFSLLEISDMPEVNLALDLTYDTIKNLTQAVAEEFCFGMNPQSGYSIDQNIEIAEKTIASYLIGLALNEENAKIEVIEQKKKTANESGALSLTCFCGESSVDFISEIEGSVRFSNNKLILNMDTAIDAYKHLTGIDLSQFDVESMEGTFS